MAWDMECIAQGLQLQLAFEGCVRVSDFGCCNFLSRQAAD